MSYGDYKKAMVSYTIHGADGNDVSVSETPDYSSVVLCIQQNDDRGRLATVRLDQEKWKTLCDLEGYLRFEEQKKEADGE